MVATVFLCARFHLPGNLGLCMKFDTPFPSLSYIRRSKVPTLGGDMGVASALASSLMGALGIGGAVTVLNSNMFAFFQLLVVHTEYTEWHSDSVPCQTRRFSSAGQSHQNPSQSKCVKISHPLVPKIVKPGGFCFHFHFHLGPPNVRGCTRRQTLEFRAEVRADDRPRPALVEHLPDGAEL